MASDSGCTYSITGSAPTISSSPGQNSARGLCPTAATAKTAVAKRATDRPVDCRQSRKSARMTKASSPKRRCRRPVAPPSCAPLGHGAPLPRAQATTHTAQCSAARPQGLRFPACAPSPACSARNSPGCADRAATRTRQHKRGPGVTLSPRMRGGTQESPLRSGAGRHRPRPHAEFRSRHIHSPCSVAA